MDTCHCIWIDESILYDEGMYWNFFLAEQDDWVPSSDSYSSESTGFYCFERVLNLIESALWREDGDEIFMALIGFAHLYLKII